MAEKWGVAHDIWQAETKAEAEAVMFKDGIKQLQNAAAGSLASPTSGNSSHFG